MQNSFQHFAKQITHPVKYRLFLLTQLPSAFFAGIKVQSLTEKEAVATVPLKWFTKNPFHSVYVAVLSMAAEVSTGSLCMANIYQRKPAVSMLVVSMSGNFHKKATGIIRFVCEDGEKVRQAVEQTIQTKEGVTVSCHTRGFNAAQELVAEFSFVWSLKAKSS